MTDDLTTLLRDAGREPTIDLDADSVHARGRRRAVGRHVAVGAGALALLGVLGAGVATLLDTPEAPLIDQAPAPAPSEDATPTDGGPERAPTAAMADLGVPVVDVVRSNDGAGGLQVRVVTSEGVVQEFGTAAGALPPLSSRVVVGPDRRVYLNDQDPNLIVGGPDDSLGQVVLGAEDGLGWRILGTSEEGLPLVAQDIGPSGQFPADPDRSIQVLDVDEAGNGSLRGIAGIDVAAAFRDEAFGDESPFAADAMPEHLAVLSNAGESYTAFVFPAGAAPVVVAETGGVDSWFVDVAFYEEEVWIVTRTADGTDLWIASMDGRSVRRVPTPVGRGEAADSFVVDLQTQFGPDGVGAMTLSTATADDENGVAWSVDVQAARDAAVTAELAADAEVPVGAFDVLDAAGHVHLLPPTADADDAPLAACATDEDARLNGLPSGSGGDVWWLCMDATSVVGPGVAYPFVATEVFAGGTGELPVNGPRAVLEAWAAGPPPVAAAAGLSGGLAPEVATLGSVSVEGATAVVDLLSGPQIGVLGTTFANGALVHGIVGTVLQYDELDLVRITLDGSCEAFGALVESEGCFEFDRAFTPWAQSADAVRAELEDGRHPVYLWDLDLDGRTLTFDLVQWLTGEDARVAWEEDTGETSGPPNDYLIRNENPRQRTVSVADPVDVQLVRLFEDGDADLDPGTWDELPTYLEDYRSGDMSTGLSWNPFWLTIEDGVITAIEEQYLP